jgi:hypothetical protein
MPRMPVGSASPAYFGVLDDFPYWNAVFELYRKDELQAAVDLLEKIGIGMYGDYAIPGDLLYLEAATSADSEIVRLGERLEIEIVRSQLPFPFDELAGEVVKTYGEVKDFFGSAAPRVDTLLTLLIEGSSIPTASLRDGYFTPKTDYGKICLPMPQDLAGLRVAFAVELTYQLAFETSSGLADLWFMEAVTATMGLPSEPVEPRWHSVSDLDRILCSDSDEESQVEAVRSARRQCRTLGDRLLSMHGPEGIVRCLTKHHGHLAGRPTEHAMRAVYGMSPDELLLTRRS